jgi:hypothetical protein
MLQASSGVLAAMGWKGQLRSRTKVGAARSDSKPKSSNTRPPPGPGAALGLAAPPRNDFTKLA